MNAYSVFNCESKPLLESAIKHCHALAAMNRKKGNDVRSCAVGGGGEGGGVGGMQDWQVLLSGLARFKPAGTEELVEVILSSAALNAEEGGPKNRTGDLWITSFRLDRSRVYHFECCTSAYC